MFTKCVTSLLILVFTLSLVSDVSPFSRKVLYVTTHTQFQVQSSFLLDVVVRLCPVVVNSICIPNSCIFHIAKTGLLRCCLYTLGRLGQHPVFAIELDHLSPTGQQLHTRKFRSFELVVAQGKPMIRMIPLCSLTRLAEESSLVSKRHRVCWASGLV